jgi:hypothetical protein
MSRSGQRQDVAFLALAVAILAIAVALFVGIRSLSNRGRAKPAPPAPKPVVQKPPDMQPPGSSKHDPFKGKPLPGQVTPGVKPKPAEELKLVGVVQGQGSELLATIRRGSDRYYVRRGDRVSGYSVAEVSVDRVVLTKGGERVTLVLRHSAGSSGPKKR